jgi:hypothetical protein
MLEGKESEALNSIVQLLMARFKPVDTLKESNTVMSTADFVGKINELYHQEFTEADVFKALKAHGYKYRMLAPDFQLEWMVLVN